MAKAVIANVALRIIRGYIRYFPISSGKSWIHRRLVLPHFAWRTFHASARTRFGYVMEVHLPDLIQMRVFMFGMWEPEIYGFIADTLNEGDSFVDVGANCGFFTLQAAARVGALGRVDAIEASPSIFEMLGRNCHRNGLTNVDLHNVAASDAQGQITVYKSGDTNLGASTIVRSLATREGQHVEGTVEAKTLQAIIGAERLLSARLIKIDVEGAELSVIRGMAPMLRLFGDRTEWIVEVTPEALREQGASADELFACFHDAGYLTGVSGILCVSGRLSYR